MTAIGNIAFALRTVWHASPLGAVLLPAVTVLDSLVRGPVLAVALGRVIGGSVWPWAIVPILAMLVHAVAPIGGPISERTSRLTRHALRQKLLEVTLHADGLEHLENPLHGDRMFVARARAWATTIVFRELHTFAAAAIATAVSLVLLAGLHPLLAVLVLTSSAAAGLQARTARRQVLAVDRSALGQRLAGRLAELATAAEGAKEVRMLAIGPRLVAEHKRLTDATIAELRTAKLRQLLVVAAAAAARGAALAAGLAWLLHLWNAGRIGAGDVAMAMTLLVAGVESTGGLSQRAANVIEWSAYSTHLRWLTGYQSPVQDAATTLPAPTTLRSGIHPQSVTYTYPGSTEPALRDVNLALSPGRTIAIVGENGAGKTTLIKLLCRFYDPDSGRILVDDHDLSQLAVREWRSQTTAAFQDYLRPHTLVREAIGIGQLDRLEDDQHISSAAADIGADHLLESLVDGLDTQLGREFPNGVELSAGQWQLLALARTHMRHQPLLLILDEPSSALDPQTEHTTFQLFTRLSSEARDRGAISLFVSHRLSTTGRADEIIVMHDGTVLDVGDHDNLLRRCPLYAELYAMQEAAYRPH